MQALKNRKLKHRGEEGINLALHGHHKLTINFKVLFLCRALQHNLGWEFEKSIPSP